LENGRSGVWNVIFKDKKNG